MWRLPPKHCTKAALSKVRGECSDRVRIFQGLYKHLIHIGNFIEPNLAKVGVEGSNPFARSSFPRKIKNLQNSLFENPQKTYKRIINGFSRI
jgi:hypothetical protein